MLCRSVRKYFEADSVIVERGSKVRRNLKTRILQGQLNRIQVFLEMSVFGEFGHHLRE